MDPTRLLIGLFLAVTYPQISLASHCEIIQSQENKGVAESNSDNLIIDGTADNQEECHELCCDDDDCNVVEFRSNVDDNQLNNCFLYKCNPVDSCTLVDRNDTYVHVLSKNDQSKQTSTNQTSPTPADDQPSNTSAPSSKSQSASTPQSSIKSSVVSSNSTVEKVQTTTKIVQPASDIASTTTEKSQPTTVNVTSTTTKSATDSASQKVVTQTTTAPQKTTHKPESETSGDNKGVSETKTTFQTTKSPATPPSTVHKATTTTATTTTTTTTSVAKQTTGHEERNQTTTSSSTSSAQPPSTSHNMSSVTTSAGQNNSHQSKVTTVHPAETTPYSNGTKEASPNTTDATTADVGSTTYPTTVPIELSSLNITSGNSTFDKASEEETRSSHVLSVALIGALSFGIIFVIAVLGLAVKRCFDTWQRRHYSRIDYLVNGMYN